ncbi:molecular chaperone HtpG [Swingsia samuiensis]|uniref:Chaperone protein HtpG n=1 Tax=Swingsia samuiensis TaxID=1293412 RepID=A0A4Y6UHA5_9PROT|nr:molecular chaperone HtpG [Swingsia samuiensis]QDH16882.1 molecular chaperone HtpG [Swingsia samuiensis]
MNDKQGQTENHQFNAEVGRLLDLVVHSLYSDREIFLRELVANSADASDKRRFEALTDASLALPENSNIQITPNKSEKKLTISDDGIGMSHDELAQNLGTIARSGTRAFGEKLSSAKPEERPSLIGQFGVGFYAAFMVADQVDVTSKKAGSDEAWTWSSNGKGSFTLTPASRSHAGTDIILHMKEDAEEFLDNWRLRSVIRKWADHISWPITLRETKEDGSHEDITINQGTALWKKNKSDITSEQYTEFYRHISHAFDEPYVTMHWHAEGTTEFTSLLFLPSERPFDFMEQQTRESHIHLHVRRMFITDNAELVPNWMRFVQGVVDTEDLPLNVSREMLQTTPVLARIRKAVTKKVLAEIKNKAKTADEKFNSFWENFGAVIKEGLWEDSEYKQEIASFARFHSTHSDDLTTLDDYISRMKEGQDAIYFLTGDNLASLKSSPQLEGFRSRGIEVLLLSDPVDAFWPERLNSYNDKVLRSVINSHSDLDKFEDKDADQTEPANLDTLLPILKDALGDNVKDVRNTERLKGSAVVLTSEGGPDLTMQRLMRRSGQSLPEVPPILEINARHPLIKNLSEKVAEGKNIHDYALVLLNLAKLQEGESLKNPNEFSQLLLNLLVNK